MVTITLSPNQADLLDSLVSDLAGNVAVTKTGEVQATVNFHIDDPGEVKADLKALAGEITRQVPEIGYRSALADQLR